MDPFYNILKIAGDTSINDSISIGLLVFSGDRYFIRFSSRKTRIAKSLVSDNQEMVDFFQNQITDRIKSLNSTITSKDTQLFPEDNLYTESYFQYLNRYSNNLFQFSEPYALNKKIDQQGFDKLFHLLVGDEVQTQSLEEPNWIEFENRVKTKLLDQVMDQVHVNAKLTDRLIPSLYFSYDIDCIGMNGVITAAKSIDFNKNELVIDKNVSRYFQISTLLSEHFCKDKVDNNFYLIADEPEDSNTKAHQIWTKLMKQKQIEMVSSEEAGKVAEKIYETKAHKFIDLFNQE